MLDWKIPGVLLIVPTMLVALMIAYYSRHFNEFWLNLAIVFWISANASWMVMEFYDAESYKYFTLAPFGLGLICTGVFYSRRQVAKSTEK